MCYYSFSNNLKKNVLSYILDMYSPKIFRGLKIGGEKNKCYVLYFRKFFIGSSTRLHKSSRHWTWVSIKLPATNHQSFNIFTQNAHSPPSFSLCQYGREYFWVDKCSKKSIHHGERFLQQDNWTSGIPQGVR